MAEQVLWRRLRNRALGGFKFRRQVTVGPHIVDFVCAEAHLAIEADGGQHTTEGDAKRSAFLEARGLHVIRFWNNDILDNLEGVLETVLATAQKGEGPSPCPLPRAGEGKKQ